MVFNSFVCMQLLIQSFLSICQHGVQEPPQIPKPAGAQVSYEMAQYSHITYALLQYTLNHLYIKRLIQCKFYIAVVLVAQQCLILQPCGLQPIRSLCPWNYPDKNTGVDYHSLIQEIFQTQGLDLGLLHCRRFLYPLPLSHKGSQ